MNETTIQFVSHACLKITGEFGTLVCDPWLLNEPVFNLSTWKFPPANMTAKEVIKDCDYLLITHSHEDHFHAPSLDHFPRDIPIILSAYDTHASLRAQTIELVLRKMGFHNLRKLGSWQTINLSTNTQLTAIPNAKTRDHDWENMGFVLKTPDITVLNLNDNVNDKELCLEIKNKFNHIDFATVQTGGVTMFPGCFRMSHEAMEIAANERKLAFKEQRRLLDYIQPSVIAPHAGDFAWYADQYFHNNWANRTTPLLFQEMMECDYKNSNIECIFMQPSDTWTKSSGHHYETRRIDWAHMLTEIKKAKQIFQPKLNAIDEYLHDVDILNLKQRSMLHTENIENFITKDFIDFTARFRFSIEGENSGFSFVAKADPIHYFTIDWQDNGPVDQTLYVPEHIWAAILEGKLMWNIIQWVGEAEQEYFNRDMGRLWFWLEYHIDLCNKNIQVNIAEQLFPSRGTYCAPKAATFAQKNEHEQIKEYYKI